MVHQSRYKDMVDHHNILDDIAIVVLAQRQQTRKNNIRIGGVGRSLLYSSSWASKRERWTPQRSGFRGARDCWERRAGYSARPARDAAANRWGSDAPVRVVLTLLGRASARYLAHSLPFVSAERAPANKHKFSAVKRERRRGELCDKWRRYPRKSEKSNEKSSKSVVEPP